MVEINDTKVTSSIGQKAADKGRPVPVVQDLVQKLGPYMLTDSLKSAPRPTIQGPDT